MGTALRGWVYSPVQVEAGRAFERMEELRPSKPPGFRAAAERCGATLNTICQGDATSAGSPESSARGTMGGEGINTPRLLYQGAMPLRFFTSHGDSSQGDKGSSGDGYPKEACLMGCAILPTPYQRGRFKEGRSPLLGDKACYPQLYR